ncbi:MAG: sodium:solute symporter family protein [Candidatus Woesearchaeota archaeon]
MVSAIGIVLIVVYFAIIWAVGLLSARKESTGDYLIASRKVGLLQTTASIVAVMGGMVIIAQSSLAFEMGVTATWYWVGIALGMVGLGLAVKKIKLLADKNKFLTLSDYFFEKFDNKTRILCAVILFIALYAVLVGQFIAAGSLFSPLLRISYPLAIMIMAVATLIYLVAGGFKAVIKTDFIQFLIMIVVLAFIPFSIDIGRFLPEQVTFESTGGSLIFIFVMMGFFAVISGPEAWQRVFASKSIKTARNACFLSAILFLVFGLSLTIIGISAKNHFPNIDPNMALFYGLFKLVPAPLVSIAVVALLAAIMSTIDTELFYLSTSIEKDFLHHKNERRMARMIRRFILIIAIISALTAIVFSNILTILFGIVSLLLVITPAFLASLKWRLKPNAVFMSLAAGLLSLIILIVTGSFSPDTSIITFPTAAVFLGIGQIIFRNGI